MRKPIQQQVVKQWHLLSISLVIVFTGASLALLLLSAVFGIILDGLYPCFAFSVLSAWSVYLSRKAIGKQKR